MTPYNLDLEPQVIRAAPTTPVRIVPIHTGSPPVGYNAMGVPRQIDLDGLSDTLAALVEDSLRISGATIADDGREVGIQVVYIDFMSHSTCMLDFTITLEGVRPFGLQTYGRKANYVRKGCAPAFERAAEAIFSDARTLRALAGP